MTNSAKVALPIKYRPKNLSEVIGQDQAIGIIKGVVSEERFNRAILLYGPTGCGKTSIARILAHLMNCENVQDGRACWECDYCQRVKEHGTYPDVQELNFSEQRGIDSVRSLIDDMQYEGQHKYKVYILDEMHKMTEMAANALLKPLEEPPPHVAFILATSDLRGVLPTIANRCLRVPIKLVENEPLCEILQDIAEKEEIVFDKDYIFRFLTVKSHGVVREALTLLERAVAFKKANPNANLEDHDSLERGILPQAQSEERIFKFYDYLLFKRDSVGISKFLISLESDRSADLKSFVRKLYEIHRRFLYFSSVDDQGKNFLKTKDKDNLNLYLSFDKLGGGTHPTLQQATAVLEMLFDAVQRMSIAYSYEEQLGSFVLLTYKLMSLVLPA